MYDAVEEEDRRLGNIRKQRDLDHHSVHKLEVVESVAYEQTGTGTSHTGAAKLFHSHCYSVPCIRSLPKRWKRKM